jgi:hypothetical protein
VYIAACAALLGGALGATLPVPEAAPVLAGVGITIGGALAAVHGWYVNIARPRARAVQWERVERPRLEQAAAEGLLVVDSVRPRSPQEAHAMVEHRLAEGRRVIGRHGPHSVFWIPMEVIGLLAVVGGILLAAVTAIGALTA